MLNSVINICIFESNIKINSNGFHPFLIKGFISQVLICRLNFANFPSGREVLFTIALLRELSKPGDHIPDIVSYLQ